MLETIFAESKEITIGNRKIQIKQVELEQIPKLTKIFSGLKGKRKLTEALLEMVTNDFDSIKDLISSLTDLPKEDVSRLNLAATVKIATEVVKENLTFFEKQVMPMMEEINQVMAGLSKSKN